MKNICILLIVFCTSSLVAQIDANSVMGLPTATTTEMTAITGAAIGATLFNTDEQVIYRLTSTGWQRSTDDQLDSEVLLDAPIDVDEGGITTPTNETNVQQVIQAIAPITSKAARVFYPPSIEIDASSNGTFTVDLYAQYTAQFATPIASSPTAPATVPVYNATDLYYYVTYADPAVFDTGAMMITADGELTYTVNNQPTDYNSLINVVFVVK
ncbi:hypothetical protein ACE939_10110 [Aquimarina sp. W85]|uniref:hypothetical protein n=1 Tax=Aquimarina rhodophyticola TaxID=3342246 RepID=UPI00366B9D57